MAPRAARAGDVLACVGCTAKKTCCTAFSLEGQWLLAPGLTPKLRHRAGCSATRPTARPRIAPRTGDPAAAAATPRASWRQTRERRAERARRPSGGPPQAPRLGWRAGAPE